ALDAETRAKRTWARAPARSLVLWIVAPLRVVRTAAIWVPDFAISAPSSGVLLLPGVELEGPGGGELSELVTDHRLGDVHGDVLASVVNGDGVADHVRDDGGAAGPGLYDLLVVGLVQRIDLFEQVIIDERALLE